MNAKIYLLGLSLTIVGAMGLLSACGESKKAAVANPKPVNSEPEAIDPTVKPVLTAPIEKLSGLKHATALACWVPGYQFATQGTANAYHDLSTLLLNGLFQFEFTDNSMEWDDFATELFSPYSEDKKCRAYHKAEIAYLDNDRFKIEGVSTRCDDSCSEEFCLEAASLGQQYSGTTIGIVRYAQSVSLRMMEEKDSTTQKGACVSPDGSTTSSSVGVTLE